MLRGLIISRKSSACLGMKTREPAKELLMRIKLPRRFAAALCMLLASQAFGQTQHIFFDTSGDFGVDDNWSDPAKAPPEKPPGISLEHLSYFYYINGDRTATISAGSPNGSHFEVQHLFPGDSPTADPPTPGHLIFEGGPEPAPGEFGASLTVLGTNRFIVGQRCNQSTTGGNPFGACGGGGSVTMNGASDLLADGVVIGERDFGSLYIGPDARVRSGFLTEQGALSRQDMRIGSFGPSRGLREPIPQLLEGEGVVEVHGELVANRIIMPESGASGELRLMPGGRIDVRNIDMAIEPNEASRSSKLSIIGSTGSLTMGAGNMFANHSSVTISFTADANGVTPIISGANGDVEGANLVLDLDDFVFNETSTLMLMNFQEFGILGGEFGTVTFAGDTTATVNYDIENGDIFLSNFMSTDPPGIFGDYNDDGAVDAADYVVWRKNLGTTKTLPNDSTPGLVSPADHDVWRENFDRSSGSGAAATAVPEPSAVAVALALIAFCAAQRAPFREIVAGK
jgi:hypothetical protein